MMKTSFLGCRAAGRGRITLPSTCFLRIATSGPRASVLIAVAFVVWWGLGFLVKPDGTTKGTNKLTETRFLGEGSRPPDPFILEARDRPYGA